MLRCKLCSDVKAEPFFEQHGYDLARCENCECVFVANPPSDEEIDDLYRFDEGYHTSVLTEAGEQAKVAEAKRRADIVTRRMSAGSVLDIGCSGGHFLGEMKRRGWDVAGVELSPDTAQFARNAYSIPVHCGSLNDYEAPADGFDVVTMWDVIEHVPDPMAELRAIGRMLKNNGLLILFTPNIHGLFPRLSLPVAHLIGRWPHPEPPHHLFQFSKTSIEYALNRTGYAIDEIEDERISLRYQIGDFRSLPRSPKRLLYWTAFSPVSLIGPLVGAGDQMLVFAQKARLSAGRHHS